MRRRARATFAGAPVARQLLQHGWLVWRCLVWVRVLRAPPLRRFSAATQALQRRHSGALSRAKSAMCCCGGWLAVRRAGPGARSWELGLRPARAPPPSPSPRARALGRYRSLSTPPNAAGGRKNL